MVSVDEVRKMAAMDILFGENNQEEKIKQHIEYVKKEIYSELEKLENKHYFWKWCKDNFELFNNYELMYGCIITEEGKSVIYGKDLWSKELVLTISKEKSAAIFLRRDRVFNFWTRNH